LLFAEAYRDRARDGLLIGLLFESAVRVSEASRLDATDVAVADRSVKVVQGKGGKDRLVFMTEDLAQLVRPHRAHALGPLGGRP
jgi:site-specific recombinase XerD